MRRALDRLYAGAFATAAACLAAIALMVLAQIAGRSIDTGAQALGLPAPGLAIPSIAEIGSFLFVAAVFLGLGGTLRAGGHVRVTLAAQRLPAPAARWLTAAILALALALALWATWNTAAMALDSAGFGAVSYGVVPVPLVLPQAVMALGLAVFSIALADEGVAVLCGRHAAFRAAEATTEAAGDTGIGGH